MNELLSSLRLCVAGPGRLGSAVLAGLAEAGIGVASVAVREGAARPQAAPPRLPLEQAVPGADVIWLTVPDDAIHPVAERAALALRALPPRPASSPLYALHSSGLGSVQLLSPLRDAGAHVLCVHPLQTFAGTAPGSGAPNAGVLHGVPAAVTAADDAGAELGEALAHALGMRPFRLADNAKPLYHLAAAVASNLFVALESEAARLMDEATGRADGMAVLGPLLRTTLDNLLETGPSHALTGPVARGDAGTVRQHLRQLDDGPERLARAYRALSLEALTLAAPRLDNETVRTLKTLLEGAPA